MNKNFEKQKIPNKIKKEVEEEVGQKTLTTGDITKKWEQNRNCITEFVKHDICEIESSVVPWFL